MGNVKPVYRRLLFYTLLLLIVMGFSTLIQDKDDHAIIKKLETRHHIISQSKVSITPYLSDKAIELELTIESYQNPEILTYDPTDFCSITLSNTLQSMHWVIHEQSPTKLHGRIVIDSDSIQSGIILAIDFFLEPKTSFSWVL